MLQKAYWLAKTCGDGMPLLSRRTVCVGFIAGDTSFLLKLWSLSM
jgi:hypothetical protein